MMMERASHTTVRSRSCVHVRRAPDRARSMARALQTGTVLETLLPKPRVASCLCNPRSADTVRGVPTWFTRTFSRVVGRGEGEVQALIAPRSEQTVWAQPE